MLIGSHVSFKNKDQLLGSVHETLSYGANTFMFYTGAPQNTRRSDINMKLTDEALDLMKLNNININNIIVHAPYIVNLASNSNEFAINFLIQEINRCQTLGITKIVLHPGSSVSLSKEEGLNNIINALKEVVKKTKNVTICLETMAGKGSELGSSFEELQTIISEVNSPLLGVCMDTCHMNDAGYNVENFDQILDEFDQIIGLDKLKCIHINDSLNERSMKKDRHANLGYGTLGFDNIINIIYNKKIINIPKILETPYVDKNDQEKRFYPPYKFEIEMIKAKKFNPNLISDIKAFYQ